MTQSQLRTLALAVLAALIVIILSACETSGPARLSHRSLPQYESAMPRSEFQNVRTTAYTHTEADHREFTNHNALGGELQAASAPIHRAENTPRAIPVALQNQSDYQTIAYTERLQPFSMDEKKPAKKITAKANTTAHGRKVLPPRPPRIGSAAADWGRWPAGTTFRLLSTGQIYRVDDYGWALAGRNTIDLYMASRTEMDKWGARQESIQVLHWGDPEESLRLLRPHQNSRHIQRMILELEGREEEAAELH